MKSLILALAFLSTTVSASGVEIICGTDTFYGPSIRLTPEGSVSRANFQSGYSGLLLRCGKIQRGKVTCAREASGIHPNYEVTFDLENLEAQALITPVRGNTSVKQFECKAY